MRIVKKAKIWFGVLFGLFLLLNIPPLAVTLYYSLIADPFSMRFSGLVNYVEMIGNKYFVQAAGNTALFTCAFVPLLLVISLLLAMHFSGRNTAGTVLISAFILPAFLPAPSVTDVFRILYGSDILSQVSPDLLEWISTGHIYLWKNMGLLIILLLAALRAIPMSLYEAASLDGAGKFAQWRYITLPGILPTLIFTSMLAAVQAFRIFREAYLLYGAYPGDMMYMLQHYINNHFYKFNYQKIAPVSVVVLLVSCTATTVLFSIQRKWTDVEL